MNLDTSAWDVTDLLMVNGQESVDEYQSAMAIGLGWRREDAALSSGWGWGVPSSSVTGLPVRSRASLRDESSNGRGTGLLLPVPCLSGRLLHRVSMQILLGSHEEL